nr:hypothetical protein [Tanacetum cinerariifolium]
GISDSQVHGSSQSPWRGILSMVKSIKLKGVDLLSLCRRKLGNGETVSFWDDCWLWRSVAEKRNSRGRIEASQFKDLRLLIELVVLNSHQDTWTWSLGVLKGYTVASVCSLIDLHFLGANLNATRWNHVETVNHIFFTCDLAKVLWALLAKRWELDVPFCASISDWLSWLDSSSISSKARVFLDGVGAALMWSLWSFRNRILFSTPSPKKYLI